MTAGAKGVQVGEGGESGVAVGGCVVVDGRAVGEAAGVKAGATVVIVANGDVGPAVGLARGDSVGMAVTTGVDVQVDVGAAVGGSAVAVGTPD